MTPTCHWFARWLHAHRRSADAKFLIPAIIEASQNRTDLPANMRALAAFQLFCAESGQEHWNCPCGDEPRLEKELELRGFVVKR
jgi:hypothetical protein